MGRNARLQHSIIQLIKNYMNHYEQKIQEKKERYQALSVSNREKATALYEAGSKALELIPFGQPILVGHHSERADRAYRGRAVHKLDKSFETSKKADYYEQKAESVGTSGISSDDPDAIVKLKEKLAGLEAKREEYKALNKKHKSEGKDILPGFYLTNLGGNIRSTKQRIEQLTAKANMETKPDIIGDGFILRENKEDNRIQFIFNGKPSDEVRNTLKCSGFRWSPTSGAWQTFLTNRGRYQATRVMESLKTL